MLGPAPEELFDSDDDAPQAPKRPRFSFDDVIHLIDSDAEGPSSGSESDDDVLPADLTVKAEPGLAAGTVKRKRMQVKREDKGKAPVKQPPKEFFLVDSDDEGDVHLSQLKADEDFARRLQSELGPAGPSGSKKQEEEDYLLALQLSSTWDSDDDLIVLDHSWGGKKKAEPVSSSPLPVLPAIKRDPGAPQIKPDPHGIVKPEPGLAQAPVAIKPDPYGTVKHEPTVAIKPDPYGVRPVKPEPLPQTVADRLRDLYTPLTPQQVEAAAAREAATNNYGAGPSRLGGPVDAMPAGDEVKVLLKSVEQNLAIQVKPKEQRIRTPYRMTCQLLEHQKIGVEWMKNQEVGTGHHGGILADDMGLGKTIQTIALMLLNPPKSADKAKTTLIVCPTSLLHQWQRELTTRTIAGTFKIFLHYGPKKAKDPRTFAGYDVVLTTFGTLAAEFPDLRNETKPQKGDSFAHLGEAGKEEADREFERDMVEMEERSETIRAQQGPLGRNVWYRCVLDEAHKISNKRTKVANSAKWLTAKYRWCLTGTPFSNSVEELFSLLQFLAVPTWSDWKMFRKQIVQPIRHGSSRRAIEKVHVLLQGICLRRHKMSQLDGKPILETLPPKTEHSEVVHFSTAERDFYQALENRTRLKFNEYVRRGTVMNNYANILALLSKLRQACCHPNLIKTVAVGPGEDDGDEDDEDAQDTGLARRMSATVVQRVKEQGLDAVECAVCTDQVVFDEGVLIQACGHGYCRTCIEAYIEGGGNNGCPQCRKEVNEDALVRFETFRKVHMPEAVPKPKPEPKDEEEVPPFKSSAKIDRCLEILDRIRADKPGEKTIVFTQWLGIHALLAVPLAQRGMRFVRIDGRMNVKKRAESVEAFANDPNVNILIISLQCGSLGLNLTCANHVVLFDVWWNPQVEGQAMDRAHRFGQTKPVSVHKITVADSVEDRILELQDRKRKMFQAAFDGGSLKKIGGRLTLGELQDLFGREDPQGGEDDDDLF